MFWLALHTLLSSCAASQVLIHYTLPLTRQPQIYLYFFLLYKRQQKINIKNNNKKKRKKESNMNKPTSLFTAPPSPLPPLPPPSSKTGDALANDKQMSFSLLKCYDRVIERIYSSITLQSWLHEACVFFLFKEKVASQRERERKKRESEYFH